MVRSNDALEAVVLSELSGSVSFLEVQANPKLRSFNADALQRLDNGADGIDAGIFSFVNNAALTTISLANLGSVVGGLKVFGNPSLTLLSIPSLVDLQGTITICFNSARFVLPVTTVAGKVREIVSHQHAWEPECAMQPGNGRCTLDDLCPGPCMTDTTPRSIFIT